MLKRGLITSSASAASELGELLAVGVSALTVNLMSAVDLNSWGWRSLPRWRWISGERLDRPFDDAEVAGVRTAASQRNGAEKSPTPQLRQSPRGYLPGLRDLGPGFDHLLCPGSTYVPAFLTSAGALGEGDALWLSTIAAVVVILVTPLAGALGDRLGRKPVLILLAGCAVVLPITMFALMAGGSQGEALFGAIILACLGGGVSAVGAVATAEANFPVKVGSPAWLLARRRLPPCLEGSPHITRKSW